MSKQLEIRLHGVVHSLVLQVLGILKFIWVAASLWNALYNYCTQSKYYYCYIINAFNSSSRFIYHL